MDDSDSPRCDVRGCVEPADVLAERRWHCIGHADDLVERWLAAEIYPWITDYLPALDYR